LGIKWGKFEQVSPLCGVFHVFTRLTVLNEMIPSTNENKTIAAEVWAATLRG